MSEERFATLRELLALWPQEAIWEQLCAILRWWPESAEREAAIDYVDAHLERWPDSLRELDLSIEWPRFPYEEPSPLWRLGRIAKLVSFYPGFLLDQAAWREAMSSQHMGHIKRLACQTDIDEGGQVAAFAADIGSFKNIECLHITGLAAPCEWLVSLCLQTPHLRVLRLAGTVSVDWLSGLVKSPLTQQLQDIEITGLGMSIEPHAPQHQEIQSCLMLLQAFSSCQSLSLENIPLLPATLEVLDGITKTLPLKSLHLSRCELYDDDIAWQAFLQDASLSSLEGFSLRYMPLPDACLDVLIQREWSALSSLSLVGIGLTRRELARLREWPRLYQLRSLDLGRNPLRNRGFRSLLQGPTFLHLQSLSLVECELTLPSMVALAATPHLPALERLTLRNNDLRSVGVRTLAGAKQLKRLKHLDVSDNAVYWTGYKALAQSSSLAGLESLSISSYHGYFEGKSMQALCHSSMPPGLRELRLASAWSDEIAPAQMAALAAFVPKQPLLSLSFGSHNLSAACMKLLSKAKHLKDVLSLDLNFCSIDVEGMRFLARSKAFPMLQRLQLEYNKFGDDGIIALAASKNFSRLLVLDLSSCDIRSAGVLALASSQYLGQVRELSLYGNEDIDVAAVLMLIRSPYLPYLSKLSLSGPIAEQSDVLQEAAQTLKPGLVFSL